MSQVSSLKSLSLKVVADFLWNMLKVRATPLEPTLGIKLTNLMNGLDDCSFHAPFLNCLKMIALLFQNVFNTNLLLNSMWSNLKIKPLNLENTLKQLHQYLSIPTSLKLELSHVLSTQYESYNLFQMALMIEMGFYCLDIQDYLHLSGNIKLINLLKCGKRTIKKIILRQCMYNCSACNKFTSIETQEYLISSFPYLLEFSANGSSCNDCTLRLVSKYCPHLKRLKVKNAHCITDKGIAYLYSPQSVVKELRFLSLCNTNVTARGAEKALKRLIGLEELECSNHIDTVDLLKSLSEQQLVFHKFKNLAITFTEETEKRFECKKLVENIPIFFPNLFHMTLETEVSIKPECLLFLQSLAKITSLELTLNYIEASMCIFPCENFYNYFYPQMNNLTKLCLCLLDDVCIHAVLNVTPCLKYLTIQDVIDSGCIHKQKVYNLTVSHLALIGTGESVVAKCLSLCSNARTLAIVDYDEMHFRINSENMLNLTHLSLDCLHMETAKFLVDNCKSLQVLNLINQLPGSEEAVWFQKHKPFVKLMYSDIEYEASWFQGERFSPCCLCQPYEPHF